MPGCWGRLPWVVAGCLAAAATCTAAPAAPAAPAVKLAGAPVKSVSICGAERRAVSARRDGRITVRVSRPVRVLRVSRCSSERRWVGWRKVAAGRSRRLELPSLEPGKYRVAARAATPGYFRIAGTGSGGRNEHTGELYPLLDRDRVRAPMVKFCEGPDGTGPHRPDGAELPLDRRRLVNQHLGREDLATYFNASWIEIHNAEGFRPHPIQHPKTCGTFREWVAEGQRFLRERPMFELLASARAYDNLWRVWGLPAKPADFERQVADRYGFHEAPFRNAYPLPGEDPNATDGGSGQLPLGLIQGRDSSDAYNGRVTIACSACHDSILGDSEDMAAELTHGRGNDAIDATLFAVELSRSAMMLGEFPEPGLIGAGALPFPYSAGRGLTNAFGLLDFLAAGFDMETLDISPGVEFFPNHGAAGQVQTPNWWNRAHRTRMFLGGELSGDNTRVSMALAVANTDRTGAGTRAMEPKFERAHMFFESLSPPPFPGDIDTELAEQGARVFHEKDLWSDSRNARIPKLPGNGSCASCHGVYSPRYAHDTEYLPDPRLKGVGANITPLETIQTDKARTNLVNEQFERAWNTSWWGYDELNPGWTREGQGRRGTTFERALYDWGVTNDRLSGPNRWSNEPVGYESPPLYGIWSSAPYFHNGSVPTVRGVLRPRERPELWRRPSSRPGAGGIVQGLDRSLKGYDLEDLGYRYVDVPCNDNLLPDAPGVPCHPQGTAMSVVQGELSKLFGDQVWLANQDEFPMSETDRQRRMIFNTHEYSSGNGGHDFSQALTDPEVEAVLEYLKTL